MEELTDCAFGVVDPVRGKEAAERCNKVDSAVVGHGEGDFIYGFGAFNEAEVVQ
jgi:hypothetical protein